MPHLLRFPPQRLRTQAHRAHRLHPTCPSNINDFHNHLDLPSLDASELERLKRDREKRLEEAIKAIYQRIYEDGDVKNLLGTNEKLSFFCGLIMAWITVEGMPSLKASDFRSPDNNADILPLLEGTAHLDFTGKILNLSFVKPSSPVGYLSCLKNTRDQELQLPNLPDHHLFNGAASGGLRWLPY